MTAEQVSRGLFHSFFAGLSVTAKLGLGLGLLLLFWRLIRFSILPLFHPSDPQEYPYWLPGIGHLFSFFRDSDKLLARGR